MTKNEVLKLTDPDAIWDAMQENDELRRDHDVWDHMTKLTHKRHVQFCIDAVGYYDPDICIDPIRRSTLKKYRFYRLNRH